jgi:excinuclease ABC subunit C
LNQQVDAKSAGYVDSADTISYILVDSEFKSLVLESQLIQKHKPKYNVRWMDDKSYLYIKLTKKDEFPKFFITRREREKGAIYFGPFPSVRIASNLLREIRKVFPFCTQKKIKTPCFYAKIKQCDPCPNVITQER